MFNRTLRLPKLLAPALAMLLCLSGAAHANPMQPDSYRVTAKPVVKVTPEPKTPTLSSILIIGNVRAAIFSNGEEKKVGDTITGYTVKTIEPTFVVLQRGSKEKTLALSTAGELVITPAKEE